MGYWVIFILDFSSTYTMYLLLIHFFLKGMFQNINFYAPLISYSWKLHILQHKIGTLQLEIHSFIQTSGNSTAQQCFRPILSLPIS